MTQFDFIDRADAGQKMLATFKPEILEHDVIVGDHTHVSTGAKINGGVSIGSGTFIGSGAIIKCVSRIGVFFNNQHHK